MCEREREISCPHHKCRICCGPSFAVFSFSFSRHCLNLIVKSEGPTVTIHSLCSLEWMVHLKKELGFSKGGNGIMEFSESIAINPFTGLPSENKTSLKSLSHVFLSFRKIVLQLELCLESDQ